ncbi:MAG: flagellin, partial [Candidatus Wallbacteria bacterium]|nr:flagellin [Candidatus Wallbacteria bacterium]
VVDDFTAGRTSTFTRGEQATLTRGDSVQFQRGETYTKVNTGTLVNFAGLLTTDARKTQTFNFATSTINGPNETALGYIDANTVAFSSTRDGGQYQAPVDASTDPVVIGGAITQLKVDPVSGASLVQVGANLFVDSADGLTRTLVQNGSSIANAWFAPDGSSILFTWTENNSANVYTSTFDALTNSVGARVRINNTSDTLNVSQSFNIINPENYNLGAANPSIIVQRNGVNVPFDVANGFSFDPVANSVTLNGAWQRGAYDRIIISYRTTSVDLPDDNISVFTLNNVPELYNYDPSQPGYNPADPASIRVFIPQQGNREIAYNIDPIANPNSGYTYDPVTRRITVYGNDRPAGNQTVAVYYAGDTTPNANGNGLNDIVLNNFPEVYNVDPSLDINPALPYDPAGPVSLRVYRYRNNVFQEEIQYDATMTSGFTYNPATRTVTVYGTEKQDALDDIRVYYAVDTPSVAAINEENEFRINGAAGVLMPLANTKIVEINENGVWVPVLENSLGEPGSGDYQDAGVDPGKYFSINYTTGVLKLHGDARLDPDRAVGGDLPRVRITYVTSSMNNFTMLGTIADYALASGNSESVAVNGTDLLQQQFGPDGYRIGGAAGNIITLQGDDSLRINDSIRIEYVVDAAADPNDGNAFLLPQPVADYGAIGSEVVRFTGQNLNGSFVNLLLTRGVDYIMDPVDPSRIILQGNSRLSENDGAAMGTHGQRLSVEFLVDDPANPNDGNVYTLPSDIETSYITETVLFTGQNLGTGAGASVVNQVLVRNVDYTLAGNQLTLIGNARLLGDNGGAGHTLQIQYLEDGGNVVTLTAAPPQYEPGVDGSELVWLTGNTLGGAVANQRLTQGTDYLINGNQIELIGNSRLVGSGPHSIEVNYIGPNENTFQLSPPIPDDEIQYNSEVFANMRMTITRWDGAVETLDLTDALGNPINPDVNLILTGNSKSVTLLNDKRIVGDPNSISISYDYELGFQRWDYEDKEFKIQVGANEYQTLEFSFEKLTLKSLGMKDASVATRDQAEELIGIIDEANKIICDYRIMVGATHNALEGNLERVSIEIQSLTASESQIADADIAVELSTNVSANIKAQAGTAMLAQANKLFRESIMSIVSSGIKAAA